MGSGACLRPGGRHPRDADGHAHRAVGGRHHPVRRAAPAAAGGARCRAAAAHPAVRRGHQRAGQPHAGRRHAQPHAAARHAHRHRAPAVHGHAGRPHPGDGPGPHRARRHVPGPGAAAWIVPGPGAEPAGVKPARLLRAWGVPLRAVRVPTRLQFQETECGVAALAMVLAHHGRPVPLHELRTFTGVSRDCVNAADLARAARHFGMECRSYSREPAQLEELPLPLLAHIRFIHFAVVEGFTRDEVLLHDPLSGPVRMPRPAFDEAFTGIVLVVQPAAGAAPRADAQPACEPDRSRWWQQRTAAWVATCGVAAGVALSAAGGSLGRAPTVATISLAALATALLAVQQGLASTLARTIAASWRRRLVAHLHAASAGFHAYRLPARLAGALHACDAAGMLAARELAQNAFGAAMALSAVAVLAALDPWAAACVAATVAMVAGLTFATWRIGGDARLQHSMLHLPSAVLPV
ncbi:MAG: hypothetical protein EOO24_20615, partial [Comamonadaceae bacterium]